MHSDIEYAKYLLDTIGQREDRLQESLKAATDEITRLRNTARVDKMTVKPFAHPLGKIETIKMVRILEGSGLKEAHDKVKGWERDGLVDFRLPRRGATPDYRKGDRYFKGDRVTLNGKVYECVKNTDIVCYGPGDIYCNHWTLAGTRPEPEWKLV